MRDSGIGFDSRFADRIFMLCQRLHARTQYDGTGIGLALCKKIVSTHCGDIRVETELGEGTEFFFTLPAGEGDGSRKIEAEADAA